MEQFLKKKWHLNYNPNNCLNYVLDMIVPPQFNELSLPWGICADLNVLITLITQG